MNTAKILDTMPQGPAPAAPVPALPGQQDPRAVPAVGAGATADLIEKRAQAQAAEQSQRRAAKPAAAQSLAREVGLVDDSFDVFIDLVQPDNLYRVRIFGPSKAPAGIPPPTPTADPASARAAYAAGSGTTSPAATIKADV